MKERKKEKVRDESQSDKEEEKVSVVYVPCVKDHQGTHGDGAKDLPD